MGRPANYYPTPYDPEGDFLPVTARYHSNAVKGGDLMGTRGAEVADRAETVIFWDQEVPNPASSALVVFGEEEGYFVTSARPKDGEWITAEVVRAVASDLFGKETPDGVVIG